MDIVDLAELQDVGIFYEPGSRSNVKLESCTAQQDLSHIVDTEGIVALHVE
jgi:hypothetical protein